MFTDQKIHKFTLHTVFRTELLTLYWRSQCYVISCSARFVVLRAERAQAVARRPYASLLLPQLLSFDDKFFWLTANQATLEEAPASDAKLTFAPKRP